MGERPLWPPAVPRLAARPYQSNPRGSGPEVLKRQGGHVTSETGVLEVGVFRDLQPNDNQCPTNGSLETKKSNMTTWRPFWKCHHNQLLPIATKKNMHIKFKIEILKQTWVTLREPCCLIQKQTKIQYGHQAAIFESDITENQYVSTHTQRWCASEVWCGY